MSSASAIAAVTAVLKDLLNNGLIDHNISGIVGGNVNVSALPPDRIPTTESEEPSQLNLFLYHVSPNAGWQNRSLPSRDAQGDSVSRPSLALNLHYLLSAYGARDLHGEILLGYAMQLLHETPVLTRAAIRRALAPALTVNGSASLPASLQTLSDSGLAEQIEQIKITPQTLGTEEISKLWTAFQSHYRPTAAYQISVILIESAGPLRSPLPVLTRGAADRGLTVQADLTPPFPTLTELIPPNEQISVRLGETLTLRGHHLEGSNLVIIFEHALLDEPLEISAPSSATASEIKVQILNLPAAWPAGFYRVSVSLQKNGEAFSRTTNALSMSLAPRVSGITAGKDADDNVTFTVTCEPEVLPEQEVTLAVGDREIPAASHSAQTASLIFTDNIIASGIYYFRLRVDGVESVLIDRSQSPPRFESSQQVTVP